MDSRHKAKVVDSIDTVLSVVSTKGGIGTHSHNTVERVSCVDSRRCVGTRHKAKAVLCVDSVLSVACVDSGSVVLSFFAALARLSQCCGVLIVVLSCLVRSEAVDPPVGRIRGLGGIWEAITA